MSMKLGVRVIKDINSFVLRIGKPDKGSVLHELILSWATGVVGFTIRY